MVWYGWFTHIFKHVETISMFFFNSIYSESLKPRVAQNSVPMVLSLFSPTWATWKKWCKMVTYWYPVTIMVNIIIIVNHIVLLTANNNSNSSNSHSNTRYYYYLLLWYNHHLILIDHHFRCWFPYLLMDLHVFFLQNVSGHPLGMSPVVLYPSDCAV